LGAAFILFDAIGALLIEFMWKTQQITIKIWRKEKRFVTLQLNVF
jgi:hypothetical protein